MRTIFTTAFVTVSICAAGARAAPSSPAFVATAKVPCLADADMKEARLDLQPCRTVLSREATAPGAPPGLLTQYKAGASRYLRCFYKGIIPEANILKAVPSEGGALGPGQIKDGECLGYRRTPVPGKVCNLLDGEESTEQCGELRGTWERAQLLGLWAQAIKFYRDEILKELETSRALRVTARCKDLADEFEKVNQEARAASDAITGGVSEFKAAIYEKGVNFCSPDASATTVQIPGSNAPVDLGKLIPRSSACRLAVSAEKRVAAFGYLAKCELQSRVEKAYADIMDSELANVTRTANRCIDRANDDAWTNSEGQRIFNRCYTPAIKEFFQRVLDERFPGGRRESRREPGPLPTPFDGSALSPLLIGALAFRRRRTPSRGRKLARASGFLVLNVGILAFATYWTLGCGGGNGRVAVPTLTCQGALTAAEIASPEVAALLARCCRAAPFIGKMKPDLSDEDCKACDSMTCNATVDAVESGFTEARGALQEVEIARGDGGSQADVVSRAPPEIAQERGGDIASGASLAEIGAGTIGSRPSRGGASSGNSSLSKSGGPNPNTPSGRSKGEGAGLAGGTPSSAGGAGTSNTPQTAPAAPESGLGVDDSESKRVSANAGAGGGASSGGGAGGAGGSSSGAATAGGGAYPGYGGGGGGSYGAGGVDGAGGTAQNLSFDKAGARGDGSAGNGVEGVGSGSQDPEDYFTRINLNENIFRKVEKKLDEKERLWTVQDLRRPNPASGKK